MLFDSHCHLNFKAFDEDREAVIGRCRAAGMLVMNVGAAYETSESAVHLARANDFCFASVGLHPIHVYDERFDAVRYQKLIDTAAGTVRAIGECGIDYWHVKATDVPMDDVKALQRKVFSEQIALAKKNNLALIIHGRNGKEDLTAYEMIYEIVTAHTVTRAVVHCFGGSLDEALMFSSRGYYIGFTGIVTFDKTGTLDAIIEALPLDRILIETDAPYLTPVPYRGTRNEPGYVGEVAKHIARTKNIDLDDVIAMTTRNAKDLFIIE